MIFILAIKGNEWAWKKGPFRDVEEFHKVQSTWNRAGLVFFVLLIICIIASILFASMVNINLDQIINQNQVDVDTTDLNL
jgi:hypothetical protein